MTALRDGAEPNSPTVRSAWIAQEFCLSGSGDLDKQILPRYGIVPSPPTV